MRPCEVDLIERKEHTLRVGERRPRGASISVQHIDARCGAVGYLSQTIALHRHKRVADATDLFVLRVFVNWEISVRICFNISKS